MTKLFLNRDPAKPDPFWDEIHIQAYCVMELRRDGYIVHGDANGASKTPRGMMQAKVGGAQRGWPDVTILASGGRTLWIEIKMKGGKLSKEQVDLHAAMRERGHVVHVVYADCPKNALDQIKKFL